MSSLTSLTGTQCWLTVIGLGEDGFEALSCEAQRAIAQAEVLVGAARHLALVENAGAESAIRETWPSPYTQAMAVLERHEGRRVVVLASGDPFCFGIGKQIIGHFGRAAMRVVPSRSCLTLACARLGWSAQDIRLVSLCGRPMSRLVPLIQPGARLVILSADEKTPERLAEWLCARGCGESVLHLLEALDGPYERQQCFRACEGPSGDVARLNMIGVEVVAGPDAQIVPLASGLPDSFFDHDGQITKQEVRAVTLSALAPRQGEILWDLGAGSGSVGIEWMLRHPTNRAFAFERDPQRCARIARNAEALGVDQLHVEQGDLPVALPALPAPDAVFIGGGVGLPGMLEMGWSALAPGGRLVANAVTIEGEKRLFEAFQAWGGALSRIGIERLGSIGDLFGFRPAMTVTQYRAVKP